MIDWTKPMRQTYEYYTVDPASWGLVDKLNAVTESTIDRDAEKETIETIILQCDEELGESYIRPFLIAEQNSEVHREPLGTFLLQTNTDTRNDKRVSSDYDGYSPLIELKEKLPPIGYALRKGQRISNIVCELTAENVRAPLGGSLDSLSGSDYLIENFVAEPDDTWMTFLNALLNKGGYRFGLDNIGRITFELKRNIKDMKPVYKFNDDNSSILLPSVSVNKDLYGVPNVVEVVYSTDTGYMTARARNTDIDSVTSVQNRGREIVHRVFNPDLLGEPTKSYLTEYAENLLRDLSTIEYEITFSHGYYPVRVGDCVLLNYESAGLKNIKAKIVSQSIKLQTGCIMEERAVYTVDLL